MTEEIANNLDIEIAKMSLELNGIYSFDLMDIYSCVYDLAPANYICSRECYQYR